MPGQSKIANLLQSLLTFFVSLSILSCTDEFSITDYSLDKLESIAGRWESGTITRDPSIAVKVSGKSDATWVLKVTLEDGKSFSSLFKTGQAHEFVLDGLGLSADNRIIEATVVVSHAATAEVLAEKKGIVLSVEGSFPEEPVEDEEQLLLLVNTMQYYDEEKGDGEFIDRSFSPDDDSHFWQELIEGRIVILNFCCLSSFPWGNTKYDFSLEENSTGVEMLSTSFSESDIARLKLKTTGPGKGAIMAYVKGEKSERTIYFHYTVRSKYYDPDATEISLKSFSINVAGENRNLTVEEDGYCFADIKPYSVGEFILEYSPTDVKTFCEVKLAENSSGLQLTAVPSETEKAPVSIPFKSGDSGDGNLSLFVDSGFNRIPIKLHYSISEKTADDETIKIEGASLSAFGEKNQLKVHGGHSTSLEIEKDALAELCVTYSVTEYETGAIEYSISPSGGNEILSVVGSELDSDNRQLKISLKALSEGDGKFAVTLRGVGPETTLNVSYSVIVVERKVDLSYDRFIFAENYDAYGTVTMSGFRGGEKCTVLLYLTLQNKVEERRAEYHDVNPSEQFRILLWKAGEARDWNSPRFRIEVLIPGREEAVASTTLSSPTVITPAYYWISGDGVSVRGNEGVRSYAPDSNVQLTVVLGYMCNGHVNKVTVEDCTSGKTYSNSQPEPNSDSYYIFGIRHPSCGKHTFVVTLDTDEGVYSLSFDKEFVDVWTVTPFIDGSSLYADLRGPEQTLGTRCALEIFVEIYAVFNYTVAVEHNGEKVDEPSRWWHYIETRGLDYTIERGTGQTTLKIQTGWVNTALRHIKSVAEGLSWSVTGGKATRWMKNAQGGMSIINYTPSSSKPGVILTLKADNAFYASGNDIVLDFSKIGGTLSANGIVY